MQPVSNHMKTCLAANNNGFFICLAFLSSQLHAHSNAFRELEIETELETEQLTVTQPDEQADNCEVCLCLHLGHTTSASPVQPSTLLFVVHRTLMKWNIKIKLATSFKHFLIILQETRPCRTFTYQNVSKTLIKFSGVGNTLGKNLAWSNPP